MKTTAVIAVRMGSSRLPGKALMDIHGASMLERLVQRVQRAEAVDEVMLATTSLPDDDRLEALAKDLGLKCFRGSENDVLERIALARQMQKDTLGQRAAADVAEADEEDAGGRPRAFMMHRVRHGAAS